MMETPNCIGRSGHARQMLLAGASYTSSQMTVRSKLLRLMGIAFERTCLAQKTTTIILPLINATATSTSTSSIPTAIRTATTICFISIIITTGHGQRVWKTEGPRNARNMKLAASMFAYCFILKPEKCHVLLRVTPARLFARMDTHWCTSAMLNVQRRPRESVRGSGTADFLDLKDIVMAAVKQEPELSLFSCDLVRLATCD